MCSNFESFRHPSQNIYSNMPRAAKSKTFIWRNDGPEQEYLKNLFLDGTISKDTPWQEVYDTYNSIWPGKLLSSLYNIICLAYSTI